LGDDEGEIVEGGERTVVGIEKGDEELPSFGEGDGVRMRGR